MKDSMDGMQAPKRGSRWKHLKTGNEYRVILGDVVREKDGTLCVIYARVGETKPKWERPLAEFLDGRFEEQTQTVKQQG
jgi:hypothetical protein